MKLIDTSVRPPEGTWRFKLCEWFCDHINFCVGVLYNKFDKISGEPLDKPDNPVYNWFYKYWLFPFQQNDCICCNTVRGVLYGVIAGFLLGRIL